MSRVAQTRRNGCPVCKSKNLRQLYEYGDGVSLHCGDCTSLLLRRDGITKWVGKWEDGADLDGVELVDAAMRDGYIPADDQDKANVAWALAYDPDNGRRKPRPRRRKKPTDQPVMTKEMKAERKRLLDGVELTGIREKLGLTQRQMAMVLGKRTPTSHNEYSRWERGIHQVPPSVMAFAKHLERDHDDRRSDKEPR